MASVNRVIIAGNLTRDPEVRYLPSGMAVAEMGLAINDSYKNKAGELVERTCFVDVVVWGRQAETSSQYLSKGSPALIEGKLQLDQWENKQGEKRSKLRVRADRVQFLGSPKRSDMGDAPSSGKATGPAGEAEPDMGEQGAAGGEVGDDDDLPF